MKKLIINADDCNLTGGVTRGILKAHDEGILTSTTFLVNLPVEEKTVREIRKRRRLGVGLHSNVTLGFPISPGKRVHSLLKEEGRFKRPDDYWKKRPSVREVFREYDAQIRLFKKHFGRKPDHLDTHHHLHNDPLFFQALALAAKQWRIPVRRSRIFQMSEHRKLSRNLPTTDFLFGCLDTRFLWSERPFLGLIETLPAGTSEIACHPGFCDAGLRKISSLREGREDELRLFSNGSLRRAIAATGIELTTFAGLSL